MKSGIYQISNTVNGKSYVGSAVDIQQRWRAHRSELNRGKHHSVALQRAWAKHGENSFGFSILELVAEPERLIEREQFWISEKAAYGARGYNMCPTAGNCLGRTLSQESRAKMSASATGKIISAETRMKISASAQAVSREVRDRIAAKNTGQKRSEETRRRMSEAQKGKSASPETRAKLALIASNMPQEQRDKIAASLRGRKRIPHTPESIEKMRAAKMGHSVSMETRQKISAALKGGG